MGIREFLWCSWAVLTKRELCTGMVFSDSKSRQVGDLSPMGSYSILHFSIFLQKAINFADKYLYYLWKSQNLGFVLQNTEWLIFQMVLLEIDRYSGDSSAPVDPRPTFCWLEILSSPSWWI